MSVSVQPITAIPAEPERIEFVTVTPEIAEEWLGKNVRNRNLKPHSIDAYARDMAAGNWRMTGESIKFSRIGTLLDGQNRLHAVIQAGVPVRFLVIWGLNSSAQEVMDGGTRRTNADQLRLAGIQNATDVASIAAVQAAWQSGYWPHAASSKSVPRLTHAETLDRVRENPILIEAATEARRIGKPLPLPTGAIGTAWIACLEVSADATSEFFADIEGLRTRGPGDPRHTLLKRAQEDRLAEKRLSQATALFYIFRTWNAWRRGTKLTKLQVGGASRGFQAIGEPR